MSSGKVVIVVTSHSKLGTTDKNTGWYLPEVAHPYDVFTKENFEVVFISPKGGKAPMDEGSGVAFKEDSVCQSFLKNKEAMDKIASTGRAKDINPADVKGLFYAGGHGPMFDLPHATDIAELGAALYERGCVLGAVCHGTVGFVPIKVGKEKTSIVEGQTVTSFTNAEEDAVQLSAVMPFMLETRLKELKANFVPCENWACNVQVSGKLVTGQNPASATETAKAMVKLMK